MTTMIDTSVDGTKTMPTGGIGTGTTKLPHSHSSPATMESSGESTSPESELKKSSGKLLSVVVLMLDDSNITFHIQHKALGQVLFDQVCKQLNLLEVDYFGLEYCDCTGMRFWLDHEKPMNRQLGLSLINPLLKFSVKFYTPDPAQLEEEYTRYLFCLQIKQDLALGVLNCNDNTAALMASYIVQAECGDFVAEDYPDHTYLSSYKFVPHQDEEMERRIMENHKKHVCQSPAEADLNLLETARRCESYGIKMHSAKDHEGVPLNLAVAHMGVLVFQNYTKINTFSWAKIRKLSFKRKRFLLKLHPEGYGYYKDTVEFFFEGRNECKNFWKKCVEHHGFFRCAAVKKLPRQKTRVLSRGSSFRYSGRTQKQIVEYVRDNYVKRQPFQRSQSFRHSSSAHSGVGGGLGQSISAQPLLPLRDGLVRAPASHSCGSVVLNNESPSSPEHRDLSKADADHGLDAQNKKAQSPLANGALCDEHEQSRIQTPQAKGLDEDSHNVQEERTPLTGSHSTLNHDSTRFSQEAPEYKINDNDDNVSHDSYLLDDQFSQSPEKPCRKGFSRRDDEGDQVFENGNGEVDWDSPLKREAMRQTSKLPINESDMNGDIPYILHRRHYGSTSQPDKSLINDSSSLANNVKDLPKPDSLTKFHKPTSSARVMVEVDHHKKNSQTSPTLYARSRFIQNSLTSPPGNLTVRSDLTSPKSPKSRVVDFVSLHNLPASHSYSYQDDSVGMGSLEQEIFEHLSLKKQQSSTKITEAASIESSDIKKSDASLILNSSETKSGTFETICAPDNTSSKASTIAEGEKLEPPCNIADTNGDDKSIVDDLEEATTDTAKNIALLESLDEPLHIVEDIDEAPCCSPSCEDKNKFFLYDIHSTGRSSRNGNFEVSSDAPMTDEGMTLFGVEETFNDVEFVHPDEIIHLRDRFQHDGDLDDDDEEYAHNGLMFPMRTLSRISERSTSDSKTSSPSDSHSKPSDEQLPSIADLPSDYSSSDDNPPPSFESDASTTLYQISETQIYENQFVFPEDEEDDSRLMETTYYLEINSDQKEQLEKLQLEGGPIYKMEYNSMEGEDTSSADNSTLCEDTSLHDNILDDIEEQTEALASDVETYEGLNVRIHISPNKSPSPIRTPDQHEVSSGSTGVKRRHRSVLQLQVSNGQILEDSQSSTTSPIDDSPTHSYWNPCSRDPSSPTA